MKQIVRKYDPVNRALKRIDIVIGPVYTISDSYRRATIFVLDRGAIYITPELSDA